MNFLPLFNAKVKKIHNSIDMAFWDNVAIELDYLGMTNKELAEKVGITASNIGKGQRQGSSPSADTAVKIASVLGVTVEYLVTGSNTPSNKNKDQESEQLRLYRKHSEIIKKCEQLPPEKEKLLTTIADNFEKSHS